MPRKPKKQAYDYLTDPRFLDAPVQDKSIFNTATGEFSPVSSLYDDSINATQGSDNKPIRTIKPTDDTPFVGDNNLSYGGDAGSSIQDTYLSPANVASKDEFRGQHQGFWNKMGSGLTKGLILTGTTAADGIIGTAVGLANMGDDSDPDASTFSKFWNNPFTKMMDDINNKSEEWIPNYYTNEEQQSSFLGQMATTNFWADKFLKNLGFTAGAVIDGMITGGVSLEAMGAKSLASKLPSAIAQAAMNGDKALGIALEANKSLDIANEVIKNANKLRNVNRISQGLGAILSVQGESRFEAIGNSTDFYNKNKQILDNKLVSGELTRDQYDDQTDRLIKAKEGYGNTDFAMNTVLLGLSNAIQFKNLFTKGFNPTKAVAEGIEGSIESGYTYTKPIVSQSLKAGKNILAEGIYEEMGQFAAQKGADDFYQKKFDGKITNQVDDFFKSAYKGLSDSYGTREGWDQGLIGSLTGAIGLPGLTKNQKTGERKLDWQGGIWGDIGEIKHENEFNRAAVDKLNQVLQSDSFKDKHQTLVRGMALEVEKNQAAKEGDKQGVLTAQHKQFLNDALHFIRADKYEDFIDNIKATKNSDVNEIKSLVNTTDANDQPIDTFKGYTTDEIKAKINKNADDMIKDAKLIHDLHDAYSTQYPDMSEEAKEELIYTASTLDNINQRISDINNHVAEASGLIADQLHDVTIEKNGMVAVDNSRFNKEYKEAIEQKINSGTSNPAKIEQVKPMIKDLPTLIAQKVSLIDKYKRITSASGLKELEKKVEDRKGVEKTVKEEQKSSYVPTIEDEIVNKEDNKKYKVDSINEDGSYETTLLDAKGKETATKATIAKDSAVLDREKGQNKPRSEEEALTLDETAPAEDAKARGAFSGLRDVTTSLSISHLDPKDNRKVIVRNKELDKHISSTKNDISKATALFKINTETPDEHTAALWSKHTELKAKLDKGEKLTKAEVNKLLTTSDDKNLTELVDTMPISVTYISPTGEKYTEGISYHDTNYGNIFVPRDIRNQDTAAVKAYILEHKLRTREARRSILTALLMGKEVNIGIQGATQGKPNNTGINKRLDEVFKKVDPKANHNNITLAIGNTTNTAWTGDGMPSLGGDVTYVHPGTIYAETTATANGTKALIQLNPSKLSEEHAGIVWDGIIKMMTYGQGGKQAAYPNDKVTGLNVGQAVNMLVVWGKGTNVDHPDNVNKNMEHLRNKQLFVDDNMVLHYGQNTISLKDGILNGTHNVEEAKRQFIEWAVANKNYAIRKNLSEMGIELNKPMKKKFKIGSWVSEGKDTYAGSLIKHGFIQTDVDEFEDTKSLFHSPIIILDFSKSGLNIKNAPKEVKVAKATIANVQQVAREFAPDPIEPVVKGKIPTTPTSTTKTVKITATTPLPIGDMIITKKTLSNGHLAPNTFITPQQIKDFAIGTEIHTRVSFSVSDENGVNSEDTKVTLKVISNNGKKAFQLLGALRTYFKDISGGSDIVEINDKSVAALIEYLNDSPKTYINNAVSASNIIEQPKAKVKEEEDMDFPDTIPDFAKQGIPTIKEEVKEEVPSGIPEGIVPFKLGSPIVTTKQIEEAEDEPDVDFGDLTSIPKLGGIDNAPFRLVPETITSYKKADIKKETNWIRNKLGNVPVEVVDGLIQIAQTGRKAFGQLRKDSIALSNIAEVGTAYHEAYHRVSIMYLSDKEREGIYTEARKKWKLKASSIINKEDQIIWAHPAIGKTTALETNKELFIDWDVEFNKKRDKWIADKSGTTKGTPEYKAARNEYLINYSNHSDYVQFVTTEWNRVKNKAKSENKKLLASPHMLLDLFADDFHKVLNMTDAVFIKRAILRSNGDEANSKLWKEGINKTLLKIDKSKIRVTDKYIAELFAEESKVSDQQVEEFLAEKFREYIIQKEVGKPTGIIAKLGDWFKKMYALVKHVFTGDTRLTSTDIDKLFKSVNDYAYLYSNPIKTNVSSFEDDKWNLEYRDHQLDNIRTFKQLQTVTKGLASILMANTSAKLKKEATSKYAIIDVQAAIREINWESLPIKVAEFVNEHKEKATKLASVITVLEKSKKQENIDKAMSAVKATTVTEAKEIATKEFENSTRLANLWQETLDNYDLVYKERVLDYIQNSLKIKNNIDEEEVVTNKEIARYDMESFAFSAKDNVQATIKFLISNLHESSDVDPETGIQHFVPLDEMWSRLMADLHQADTYEEMIAIIEANTSFPYEQLARVLKQGSELMRTQFQSTFIKHRHSFFNTIFFKQENGGYRLYHRNADIQAASEQQLKSWGDVLALSTLTNPINKDKLNVKEVEITMSHMTALKQSYGDALTSGNEVDLDSYKTKLAEVLGMVGIMTNSATINKMTNDLIPIQGTDRKALSTLINSVQTGLFSKDSTLYKYATGAKIKTTQQLTVKTLFKNETIVKELAEAHALSHNLDLSDTILGAEGNKHYAYSDPSYFTDLIKDLKNKDEVDFLMSDPGNRSSFLLDQLQSEQVRNKIKVLTFSAMIQDKKGDDGRGFLDLSPIEDFLTKLSLVQKDIVTPPTLADRKTYFMLEGFKRLHVEYTKNEDGTRSINQEVVDQFMNYVESEKASIDAAYKLLKENSELDDKGNIVKVINWDNLVENYHYVTTKKGEKDYTKGNGYKYQIFESFNKKGKKFDPTTKANRPIIEGHIRKMLEEQVDLSIAMAKRLTILEARKAGETGYVVTANNLLDEEMLKEHMDLYDNNINDAVRAIMADYTINTMISSIEVPMVFMGSLAFYKSREVKNTSLIDSLDDYTKRLSILTSSGSLMRSVIPGEFEDDTCNMATLATNVMVSEYHKQLVDKQTALLKLKYPDISDDTLRHYAELRMDAYEKVDPTDAQVLISPIMFKRFVVSEGKWNDKYEEAFNLLASDKELTPEEELSLLGFVMQPLKHVYFDRLPISLNNEGDNLLVPTYVKMSEATLFRRFTKGTHLDKVLDRMEGVGDYAGQQQVHMVAYETAIKAGLRNREKLFTDPDTENQKLNNLSDWSITNLNIGRFRHQTVTDPHEEQHTLLASQMKKLGMGDISDNAIYNIAGEQIKGTKLVQNINDALSALSNKGLDKLIDKLGLTPDGKMDDSKFYAMLLDEAKKSGMPENIQESLRLGITMDALSERKWIYQKLVSRINTTTIDTKLPGNQLIQISGFGTASIEESKTNTLKFMFDDSGKISGVEAKVSLQIFKNVVPDYEKKSYEERRQWLLDNKSIMEGLGYRIPTQGQNSIVPINVVDFLPETIGDAIILPNEFTALTGSDFDIDKLFFVRFNYKVNKEGKAEKVNFLTDKNSTVEQRYKNIVNEAFKNGHSVIDKESYTELRALNDARMNAIASKLNLLGDTGIRIGNLIDQIRLVNKKLDIENRRATKDTVKIGDLINEAIQLTVRVEGHDYFKSSIDILYALIDQHRTTLTRILVKHGRIASLEEFKNQPIIDQNTEEAIQNHLLEHYRGVLLSDNNFLQASSPLDFQTAEYRKKAEQVRVSESKSGKREDGWWATPTHQAGIKYKFTGGKQGVGPAALNNTFHTMAQVAKLELKGYYGVGTKTPEGNTSLHEINSTNPDERGIHVPISDYLSASVSLHVDIAKDTSIIDLNVVGDTYNVFYFLLHAGEGSKAVDFLPQPILKHIVRDMNTVDSAISTSEISKITTRKNLVKKNVASTWEGLYQKALVTDTMTNASIQKELEFYNPFLDDLNALYKVKDTDKTAMWYAKQIKILEKFNELDKGPAKEVSAAVMATRVDTKKYGGDPIAIKMYQDGVRKVINADQFINFDKLLSLDRTDDTSFLSAYTRNSINIAERLFKDKTIIATPVFNKLLDLMATQTGKSEYVRDYELTKMSDEMYSAFMSRFFTGKGPEELGLSKEDVANRIKDTIDFIRGSNKVDELKNNILVNALRQGLTINDDIDFPGFTGIATVKADDNFVKEDMSFAWSELIQSDNPKIREFATNLFIYAFYTSGFNQRAYSLVQFIPAKMKRELKVQYTNSTTGEVQDKILNFDLYMKNLIDPLSTDGIAVIAEGINKDVLMNNYSNKLFVPQLDNKSVFQRINTNEGREGNDKNGNPIIHHPIVVTVKNSNNMKGLMIGNNKVGDPVFSPYIHYIANENESFLMEFIGYIKNTINPIYKLVNKRGYAKQGRIVKEYGLDGTMIKQNRAYIISDQMAIDRMELNKSTYENYVYIFEDQRTPIIDNLKTADAITDVSPVTNPASEDAFSGEAKIGQKQSISLTDTDITKEEVDKANEDLKHCNI